MKKLNLMIIVTVFSMILLCSCAQNNDVMASVNGIDIEKSDYEMRLKSNEIMAELMTEDINNSDFTSEEKNAKITEIKEKCSTDKETIINSMIETAYIDSKYDSITHEQAKSEIEKQMSNLDDYAVEYPQVAANGKIMDEYIKRMGITKEEYLDLAADSYISYVNKQKAKEEFAKEKDSVMMFLTKSLKHISSRKYPKPLLCIINEQKNFIITESRTEPRIRITEQRNICVFSFCCNYKYKNNFLEKRTNRGTRL